MNIAGSLRKPSSSIALRRGGFLPDSKLDGRSNSGQSPLELNFYATPPNYEFQLDEFEELALARLKVSI
jgi:hypothetical protein